jgi:FMN-dependent NADH-azoreductase
MNILQLNSSSQAGSNSTRLASDLVQGLLAAHPGAVLSVRDLARDPHPMLDEAALVALHTPAAERTPAQAARVALDDALISQLQAADVVVLGVPMYNFGIPVQLKAWFDAVARAGVTFRYTEQGPEGLLTGKTAYAVLTRGGIYRDQPGDLVAHYLKNTLGFLGITDFRPVYAEGLAYGPEAAARSLAGAGAEIQQWLEAAPAV